MSCTDESLKTLGPVGMLRFTNDIRSLSIYQPGSSFKGPQNSNSILKKLFQSRLSYYWHLMSIRSTYMCAFSRCSSGTGQATWSLWRSSAVRQYVVTSILLASIVNNLFCGSSKLFQSDKFAFLGSCKISVELQDVHDVHNIQAKMRTAISIIEGTMSVISTVMDLCILVQDYTNQACRSPLSPTLLGLVTAELKQLLSKFQNHMCTTSKFLQSSEDNKVMVRFHRIANSL